MSPAKPDSTLEARDPIDWALIGLLRDDGRASYERLAHEVGLSKVAVRARVKRLLDSGSVRVVGIAHPSLLGMSHCARVALDTVGPSLPVAQRIAEDIPGAVFVALSTGPRAVVAELRTGSLSEIERGVKALRSLDGVAASDTAVYTEILRDATMMPGRPLAVAPDTIDLRIIEELQRDGRLTFVELAGRVGLTAASVRMRMRRLLDSGAVTIQALVTNAPDDPGRLGGFSLDVHPDRGFDVQSVLEVDGVAFLAGALGGADLFGTIAARSVAELGDVVERLRELPGVARVRSWIHFRVVRENYDRPLVAPRVAARVGELGSRRTMVAPN